MLVWEVKVPGTYEYYCPPHAAFMRATSTVVEGTHTSGGADAAATTTTTTSTTTTTTTTAPAALDDCRDDDAALSAQAFEVLTIVVEGACDKSCRVCVRTAVFIGRELCGSNHVLNWIESANMNERAGAVVHVL